MSLDDELRTIIEDAVRKVLREEGSRMPGPVDDFISAATAARIASVAPGTIRTWIDAGKLRRYRAGRVLRVRRVELLEFLSAAGPDQGADDSPEALADRAYEAAERRKRAKAGRRGR